VSEIKHRELDCAKELAAVPMEEVAKIAAMLLRSSGNMTRRRRKRSKHLDQKDPLVETTAKTYELLEIAYQKCRKSRESRCQALAIVEVAKIAVTLMCDGNTPPNEAVVKALELLEIASYGNLGLAGQDSYEVGLSDFVRDKKHVNESGGDHYRELPLLYFDGTKYFRPRDRGVHNSIPPHYSAPPSNRVKPLLEFLDDIAPRITPQEPKITPQELSPEDDTEAHRIAGELVGIHRDTSDGLTDADAACFAAVLKTFEASTPEERFQAHPSDPQANTPRRPLATCRESHLAGTQRACAAQTNLVPEKSTWPICWQRLNPASLIGASNPAEMAEFESLYREPGAKRK
jgi:hypothetical protein